MNHVPPSTCDACGRVLAPSQARFCSDMCRATFGTVYGDRATASEFFVDDALTSEEEQLIRSDEKIRRFREDVSESLVVSRQDAQDRVGELDDDDRDGDDLDDPQDEDYDELEDGDFDELEDEDHDELEDEDHDELEDEDHDELEDEDHDELEDEDYEESDDEDKPDDRDFDEVDDEAFDDSDTSPTRPDLGSAFPYRTSSDRLRRDRVLNFRWESVPEMEERVGLTVARATCHVIEDSDGDIVLEVIAEVRRTGKQPQESPESHLRLTVVAENEAGDFVGWMIKNIDRWSEWRPLAVYRVSLTLRDIPFRIRLYPEVN